VAVLLSYQIINNNLKFKKMKATVLGTGSVGQTIANRLSGLGHEVVIGTRDVAESKLRKTADAFGNPAIGEWIESNPSVKLVTFEEAAAFGEIIFNCTKGVYGIEALTLAGEKNLAGKIIVDISNPLDFSKGMPPTLTISNDNSLGEEIQKHFPNSKVVKALNTMWCGLMVNPAMINGGDHSTFVCGNDQDLYTCGVGSLPYSCMEVLLLRTVTIQCSWFLTYEMFLNVRWVIQTGKFTNL
jgi:predicted dinucleotide-binding enzyme